MKQSTDTQKKRSFARETVAFFVMLLGIYLYLILGNLSTAPAFIYSQFCGKRFITSLVRKPTRIPAATPEARRAGR